MIKSVFRYETEGTKYHPLFEHLLFSGQGRLSMTFAEIEAIIGERLPPSARRREEWWSNSSNGHSQARAWTRASYRTSNIDLVDETVNFTLEGWPEGYSRIVRPRGSTGDAAMEMGMGEAPQAAYQGTHADGTSDSSAPAHPLFGVWKGKVTLLPGYDYTKPAFDPDSTS